MMLFLSHEKLRTAKYLNTFIYAPMVLFACMASHSLYWTNNVAWAMGLLAVLPTEAVALMIAYLRWHYGYADGVGGASRWDLSDTLCVGTALLCAVLYFGIVFTYPPVGIQALPLSFWGRIFAVLVANVAIGYWILRAVYRDWCMWRWSDKKTETFKAYVEWCCHEELRCRLDAGLDIDD